MSQPINERWLPIPGFEFAYEISTRGRVRRIERTVTLRDGTSRTYKCRIRKTPAGSHGYPMVNLTDHDGKHKNYTVHRLMAKAFLGPVRDDQVVRHLNDVRTDNRIENLAVGDHSENRFDSVRNGTHVEANKTHCVRGHAFTEGNIYRKPGRPNVRDCRACRRLRSKAFKARRKTMTEVALTPDPGTSYIVVDS